MKRQFSKLDFAPVQDGWNIKWPGPPRRAIKYDDVKFYTVNMELQKPELKPTNLTFDLVEARTGRDHVLGSLSAEFDANSRTPRVIKYPRKVAGEVVPGTPSPDYEGGFWLGSTKLGRVKGNGVKDDDGHVNLYLRLIGGSYYENGRWITFGLLDMDKVNSPKHEIRCVN